MVPHLLRVGSILALEPVNCAPKMPPIFDKFFKSKTPAAAAPVGTPAAGPAQYDALFAQASSAVAARNFQRAIQFYDQAIAADPTRAEGYYKRANVLKDLGQ